MESSPPYQTLCKFACNLVGLFGDEGDRMYWAAAGVGERKRLQKGVIKAAAPCMAISLSNTRIDIWTLWCPPGIVIIVKMLIIIIMGLWPSLLLGL